MLMSLSLLATRMLRGDFFSATLLAALAGFLLIGVTESLFDGPRVTTLFFLLVFLGWLRPPAVVAGALLQPLGPASPQVVPPPERAP
jgi:hypothetical protein